MAPPPHRAAEVRSPCWRRAIHRTKGHAWRHISPGPAGKSFSRQARPSADSRAKPEPKRSLTVLLHQPQSGGLSPISPLHHFLRSAPAGLPPHTPCRIGISRARARRAGGGGLNTRFCRRVSMASYRGPSSASDRGPGVAFRVGCADPTRAAGGQQQPVERLLKSWHHGVLSARSDSERPCPGSAWDVMLEGAAMQNRWPHVAALTAGGCPPSPLVTGWVSRGLVEGAGRMMRARSVAEGEAFRRCWRWPGGAVTGGPPPPVGMACPAGRFGRRGAAAGWNVCGRASGLATSRLRAVVGTGE
jgi:hypothetical protein